MQKIFSILIAIATITAAKANSTQKKLPLWEAGLGILPMRIDNYRGSPQHKWFLIPFPAYTIRGKNIEAENGLIRGHIAKFGNFTFDLSFAIGLNVSSHGDKLRKGMDDLAPTFELGPMLRYYIWKSLDEKHFLNIEFPYRAVYATDLTYIDHVGYFSVPYLNFLSKPTRYTLGWGSELSLGVQYGSRGFHNRFYGVSRKDTNVEREEFQAVSGYSGTTAVIALSKRYNNFLLVPFLRYDYLDGAVYNSSPLYKTPHYTWFGLTMVWFFSASKEVQKAPTMIK